MKKHGLGWNVWKDRGSKFKRMLRFCLPVLLVLMLLGSVEALTITMTDVGSTPMSADQLNAFHEGAAMWEWWFVDPVTVNINISFEALPNGVLGSTRVARTRHDYATVRAAMFTDATGSSEKSTISSLPLTSVTIEATTSNIIREDEQVSMATANAKALGLGTGQDNDYVAIPTGVDAVIKFSTNLTFDYKPDDGIDANKYDAVGIAAHEIGHALGFISVTDSQDYRPLDTLHISTLDLWRFVETGGVHSLQYDTRHVTRGPAEFYNTLMIDIPFSHGMKVFDPLCNAGGYCQASHWRDDQGNLMDPSVAKGDLMELKSDDINAMNFIGWNRRMFINAKILQKILIGWFFPREIPDIPDFGDRFKDFPPLPPPHMVRFPENSMLALRAGFDLGYEGGMRSGLGYATFTPREDISSRSVEAVPPVREQEWLDPPGRTPTEIPQNLSEVFIQSDMEGVPFTFSSACGINGCPFDPSLGEFGGYRVPGFIDGNGDQEVGDVDAQITLILLATDDSGAPDPGAHNMFVNSSDDSDSNIIILDAKAIGAVLEPMCGDDEHPILRADLDENCIVNMKDLAMFAEDYMVCTAPVCP